ncbi:efflux RND transporter permease subunit [Rickettsia conorii]|uniref:efflux RND transporter permease subunit n=1 Tax=Rickettsia conorii TaxID=781 RepID=UPI002260F1D6|nr:efflux RND transporter permease subunit [Rickettsia conorii]UZW39224.1 efflux RND transporter permease subunit [Rickettsia conorii subsp. heilongjiangensis]
MGISEIFIKHPVLATLFMATILLFGACGYRILPVSVLPDINCPTIPVSVNLPGAADLTTMASSVALPLEKQFSTIFRY